MYFCSTVVKCFVVSAVYATVMPYAFNALTLLVGQSQEGHSAHKKYGWMVEVGTG